MTASNSMFQASLRIGFLITSFVAVPGIFCPGAVLDFMGGRPPVQPVWPAFGFLLSFLVSWFFLAAASDPMNNLFTARLSILSHFIWAGFWYWGYPAFEGSTAPWWWVVELIIGIVQFGLFACLQRDASVRAVN